MTELEVSVGSGFALMGILYRSSQGGVGMCLGTLWECQHLDEAGFAHQGKFQLCGDSLDWDMVGTPSGRTESMENQRFSVRSSFLMGKSLPLCLSSCLGPQIPSCLAQGEPKGWDVLPWSCPSKVLSSCFKSPLPPR